MSKKTRWKVDADTLALCKKWQARLRLLDWDVEFFFATKEHLPDNSAGCIMSNINHRRAEIELLPQSERSKDIQPILHTVVHEILHLTFAPFCHDLEVGTVGQMSEEQAINALTNALTGHSWRKDPKVL